MIEYKIKPADRFSLGLNELWQYKELFYFFTWRDIKVKYKQTFLGFAWVILQPLIMMLLFSYFFGSKLNVPSEGIPYPVFVFSGLLLWNIFSSGLATAGNSMVTHANIIKKIYFPRLVIPISSVLVALFDFLISMILYVVILLYFSFFINPLFFIGALLIAILITVFTTLGAGCLFSAMNVKYRDFRYVIPFLIQSLLFITPVIYPISIIENVAVKTVLSLNPLAGAISLLRSCILQQSPDWTLVGVSFISSVLILIGGISYFKKTESYFADIA